MNKGTRVVFACALGALVGSVAGLQTGVWLSLHKVLACTAGFVVGGVLGWLTYDVKEVGLVFVRSWRDLRGWEPDWEFWRDLGKAFFFNAAWILTLVLFFYFPALIPEDSAEPVEVLLAGGIFIAVLSVVASLLGLCGVSSTNVRSEQLEEFKCMARHLNPVMAVFYLFKGAYLVLLWLCVTVLPAAIRSVPFLGKVVWKAYRYTHSELRATCFIDGGLGAMAGVWFGSPMVGLLVGLALGFVNYYVVSPLIGIRHAKV